MSNNRETTPRDEDDFYAGIDSFKLLAMAAGLETAHNADRLGIIEVTASRGESAQVIDLGDGRYLASVNEELGTKNIVADELQKITGKSDYYPIGLDTAAAQFNDLITVGAEPMSSQAHFTTGDYDLFQDAHRSTDLIEGYEEGCNQAGAIWQGGETGLLKGIIEPGKVALSGSANGIILSKERLILGEKLQHGDLIIYLPSSGIHANGLSGVRELTATLPDGYATFLRDGKMFGESLLTPTPIYADAVRSLFEAGVDIHYMANITGHGWRKLMRADKDLSYVISFLAERPPAVFDFIQKKSGMTDEQMYKTFNMGMGLAIYINRDHLQPALKTLQDKGWAARLAGHVEEGPKRVIIKPKDLVFEADSLKLR